MSLRDWRNYLQLTQCRAADAVGVSPRQWKRYEAGELEIPATVLLAMEHVSNERKGLIEERMAAVARITEIDELLA